MSEDMDEQLKIAHRVVDVVDCSNRKRYVTRLQCNNVKPESLYARVSLSARKQEEKELQQFVIVKYKLDEFEYLLDVLTYVYAKVVAN